jgi:hypothetical protein
MDKKALKKHPTRNNPPKLMAEETKTIERIDRALGPYFEAHGWNVDPKQVVRALRVELGDDLNEEVLVVVPKRIDELRRRDQLRRALAGPSGLSLAKRAKRGAELAKRRAKAKQNRQRRLEENEARGRASLENWKPGDPLSVFASEADREYLLAKFGDELTETQREQLKKGPKKPAKS